MMNFEIPFDPFRPIFKVIFSILQVPKFKLNFNYSFGTVSKWSIFLFVFISYFFFMSGIVYDMINEPPAIGSERDEKTGKMKPSAVMMYRLNGQYIIEGFTAGFLFCLGAGGFILLTFATEKGIPDLNRYLFLGVGVIGVILSYNILIMFLRMKVPGYLGR